MLCGFYQRLRYPSLDIVSYQSSIHDHYWASKIRMREEIEWITSGLWRGYVALVLLDHSPSPKNIASQPLRGRNNLWKRVWRFRKVPEAERPKEPANRRTRVISLYIWGNIGGGSQRIPRDSHFRVVVTVVGDILPFNKNLLTHSSFHLSPPLQP